ncbi:MAG: 23S rRNA (pseudouridine(1915)-N(3))-methyltransferase RlmH [Acidipila sp.]|nr:23S rRNA (pseudouridine(1915)-N(3))-methyltransferase RlmH [Acidipila sp.]
MKIRLVMLGKTKRPELRALFADYVGRIERACEITVSDLREPTEAALARLKIDTAAHIVLLDAGGREHTSQEFARWLGALRDRGARELVFLCGNDIGFPAAFRKHAKEAISLSKLTMPHELARVVLAEQIYRALAILSGHPYAK